MKLVVVDGHLAVALNGEAYTEGQLENLIERAKKAIKILETEGEVETAIHELERGFIR